MRRLCTPLLIFLLVACLLLFWQIDGARIPSAPGTLVALTEMPPRCADHILYHDYWNDFLQYTDGHEILVFRTRTNLTGELDTWTHVPSITLEEAGCLTPLELSTRKLNSSLPDLPASYTAYFLSSTFEKGEAYTSEDHFFLGLYDAKTRICIIYRGHRLYGI